ncbi:VanZ family protein [Kitasatospora sp. NBC_00240]|uniref:VanZ family protein n=1 Tax=Kitasatospora sp. NBC_00240 TaxID=2903567 RepID=UPI002257065B|nr:VanZ family protein [Kitasatospora sp. NBC_00240]MCX5212515.1 VanZ family protein [Kitasatospora sp. NBC_00240]
MRTENEPTRQWSAPPSAAEVPRPLRAAGLTALVLHLMVVGWFVLRPLPVAWVYDSNLTPFGSVRRALALGEAAGLWQVACELLLLAPLGVLLPLVRGRVRAAWLPSFLRVAGVSALLATGLEFLGSWVPGHVLNVDHILLGVAGVSLTHLAVVPAARAVLRARPAPERRPAPVPAPAPLPLQVPAPVPAAAKLSAAAYGRPAPRTR